MAINSSFSAWTVAGRSPREEIQGWNCLCDTYSTGVLRPKGTSSWGRSKASLWFAVKLYIPQQGFLIPFLESMCLGSVAICA